MNSHGKIQHNVLPEGFVTNALELGKEKFIESLKETLLLLIRQENRDEDLIPDFYPEQTQRVKPKKISFQYRTVAGESVELGDLSKIKWHVKLHERIHHALSQAPHFVAPLRKHDRSGPSFPDRITVGRASNQDLVIDHPSISKLQCWFEMSKNGRFCITDAGSTNGTLLNNHSLKAKKQTRLNPGDIINFSSIEAILCDAKTLWEVLQEE